MHMKETADLILQKEQGIAEMALALEKKAFSWCEISGLVKSV